MNDIIEPDKELNVGFIGWEGLLSFKKVINKDGKEVIKREGFIEDLWLEIKKKLDVKKINEINISMDKSLNSVIYETGKGKYDMVMGNFSVNEERDKQVNFTRPIYLNQITVLYYPQITNLQKLWLTLKNTFLPLLGLLITLGIVFGLMLYVLDPKRGRRRAILSSLASMFGEMGYISERSNLTLISITTVLLIMLVSFYFSIYLQAATISDIEETRTKGKIDSNSIKYQTLLAIEGTPYISDLQKQGAKIKFANLNTPDELLQYYFKNKNKYDGIILDYETAKSVQKKHTDLSVSSNTLGLDEIALPVNKKKLRLLNKLNNIIEELRHQGKILSLCKKYFGQKDSYLCNI